MAELLKRENDITTLKVELGAAGEVACSLQFLQDGALQSIALWQGSVEAFGIPGDGTSPSAWARRVTPRLPEELLGAIGGYFKQQRRQALLGRKSVLWVHLVKPYGALRFVPWERLLMAVLGYPVLMLPDFIFPPPRKSAAALDVAVCASAPLNCEHHSIERGLLDSVRAIVAGLREQPSRIHVFTDAEMARRVGAVLGKVPGLTIHASEGAARYADEDASSRLHDRNGSLRSPWLLWMRDELRGFSTDVVHFVCHGHLAGRSGAMLLAQSPLGRTTRYLAAPVGAAELACFQTQVGAWSTTFTSPDDNHNAPGLRALADEIAQSLPGPMVLLDQALDPGHKALASAYRFIHSPSAQAPPRSPALFMYCQPYLLADDREFPNPGAALEALDARFKLSARNRPQQHSVIRAITGRADQSIGPVDIQAFDKRSISGVTAATERVAEQVQLNYQKLLRDEVVPTEVARRDLDTAMGTVDLIRQAVSALERQRLLGEIRTQLEDVERSIGDAEPAAKAGPPGSKASAERKATLRDLRIDADKIRGSWNLLDQLADPSQPDEASTSDGKSIQERSDGLLARVAQLSDGKGEP